MGGAIVTPPEPLWSDNDIANDAKRASSNPTIQAIVRSCLLFMRHGYEAERAAHLARIVELEAELAEAKPGRSQAETGVRGGLLKGRIRMRGIREPNMARPTFDAALKMATTGDLMWALELLIKHPNAKRTWRDYRIKHIDKRIREITGAS
jgi:hypothetical protein